jgi:putative Mg2+ transporter-C (MgtC) family protein
MADPVLATSELCLRMGAALGCGVAIGLNRNLHRKRAGVRTFGLVALATAGVTLALVMTSSTEGVARGIQGILTGIGFLGAGMILHRPTGGDAHGLTTAAAVWFVAVLAVICALGAMGFAAGVLAAGLLLLLVGKPCERFLDRRFGRAPPPGGEVVDPDD